MDLNELATKILQCQGSRSAPIAPQALIEFPNNNSELEARQLGALLGAESQPAVNLTSRLLATANDCQADIVWSEAFQEIRPTHTQLASEVPFKGFDTPVLVCRVSMV